MKERLMKFGPDFKIRRNVLLNPGPATTTDSVKMAQVVPDICPREKEFGDVMQFIVDELTELVANREEYTTVLFGGSGTAGVEAVLSSILTGKKLFVLNNGAYSERMCKILRTYQADFIEWKSDFITAVDYDALRQELSRHPDVDYLCMVHHETGTGLLNDLSEIGKICKEHAVELVVDAMSSFAAIPIDMPAMNIAFLIASSNKNLQGMAGVAFVIAHRQALEKLKEIPARSFYLDLYAQHTYFEKTRQTRFTPPVQTLYALKQAILETKEETLPIRYQRYTQSWETLTTGLRRLGFRFLLRDSDQSKLITAIFEPDTKNYHFDTMHDFLYQHGFTIYPGKVSSYDTFRVANIGAIDRTDITEFLNVLQEYLEGMTRGENS
ncbi:MAG: 2-aminoethylphosphonate--pyruvate transaminase [Planctomycetia bacterium]|nr:2-aminoethylphosphonate--pyruvate transaminase [Planctomycetia bacterium]